MFFSYELSVGVVALALYGVWGMVRSIWHWFWQCRHPAAPLVRSFVFCGEAADEVMAEVVQAALTLAQFQDVMIEIAVPGAAAHGWLYAHLAQLAAEGEPILLWAQPLSPGEAVAYCQGASIHLFHLGNGLSGEEVRSMIRAILADG